MRLEVTSIIQLLVAYLYSYKVKKISQMDQIHLKINLKKSILMNGYHNFKRVTNTNR